MNDHLIITLLKSHRINLTAANPTANMIEWIDRLNALPPLTPLELGVAVPLPGMAEDVTSGWVPYALQVAFVESGQSL
jgi:hypothetical protein